MERVTLRLEVLIKALKTLEEIINLLAQTTDPTIYKGLRDAKIKRFEYCYETFWKFLKNYLEKAYGDEVASPKKIFREAFARQIITKAETDDLLQMADDRNQTSLTYNEEVAKAISHAISRHYIVMQQIAERLQKELTHESK